MAAVTKRMAEERSLRQQRIREKIKSAPIPLPNDLRQQIVHENTWDAANILREHPGFALAERCQSYLTSLAVFEKAFADLLNEIREFEEASQDGTIFHRVRRSELQEIERSIQKELFAAASAAHSLVDHSTRRLNELAKIPEYKNHIASYFGDDGLSEFIVELRNVLHHFNMVEAAWNVKKDYLQGSHSATFTVDKQTLAIAFSESPRITAQAQGRISAFLAASPDRIDVRTVFDEYRRRANGFHAWLSSTIASPVFVQLRDYESCIQENKNFATRLLWRGLIMNWLNWPSPPNPYNHLPRYLTASELAIVNSLERGSNEQIDKIIDIVDENRSCDDELRQLIYEFFRRGLSTD
ncbi:MAG TPA: hypothetical protein VNZ48_14760 [Xanthobacteraceae bacterium]|nr:hypothetical protein [Xanthobacteraceae bacterium]